MNVSIERQCTCTDIILRQKNIMQNKTVLNWRDVDEVYLV